MLQRAIYSALKSGIAATAEDPAIIDELFKDQAGYDDTEVLAIREVFSSPIEVIHGYARRDSNFPLYAVILSSETEEEQVLGDESGMIDDSDDPDFGADVYSSLWGHNFQILCYAEHPDVVTYMYDMAKYIMYLSRRYIINDEDMAVTKMSFSGGDLAPDAKYMPEHLFLRQLTIVMGSEFCRTDHDSRLGKAFKVSGIHIDSSGSPSDVGGVKTLITPYAADNND